MIKCWLCREPFERTVPLLYGIAGCPSCLTPIIAQTGEMHSDPGMMSVHIALSRAVDRLTKQLATNEENEKLARIARKLGFP